MNSAELNASLSFLTHENYNIFIQEVKQLRWCQPLSEMSENHSKCWSAKFFKRIKRNERLLSKLIELRMKWNTENSTIQKCIMGSWIKFRSECDIRKSQFLFDMLLINFFSYVY
jgi:transcription elongation GreA/GreB family factor